MTRPEDNSLEARIARLEERLDKKERSAQLGDSSIHHGALSAKGGAFRVERPDDGGPICFFGPVFVDGVWSSGWILYRHNGVPVFELAGAVDGQFWALRDEASHIVVSDDAGSGQGLARPYIPLTATPTRLLAVPGESTTGSTFGAAWTIQGIKQHPRVEVMLLVQAPAGSTGQWQVKDIVNGGAIINGPHAIGNGEFASHGQAFAVAGGHMSTMQLDIEVRLASGAGPIRTQLVYAQGIQS